VRNRTIIRSAAAVTAAAAIAGLAGLAGQQTGPEARAAATTRVTFGEYFYRAKKVTIAVGDSVRFVNIGKIEHTVADSTRSATIRSKVIRPRPLKHGQSQTVRFRKRGTVYYLCTFHPTLMKGVVVVR